MSVAEPSALLPEHRARIERALRDLEAHDPDGRWQRLDTFYANFRARFGPDVLASLEGVALLDRMHKREGQDCLMYWLEFKNDDEFPAIFGGIGGGSALKFGIYQATSTGRWMGASGAPGGAPISLAEAIEYATRQRDQLIEGCRLLDQLPQDASDDDYLKLQQDLEGRLPLVGTRSWGHKYFHLIFPDKLDSFHNEDFQRFYLLKLLQMPPTDKGRYACAGRYVRLARDLDSPLAQLCRVLQDVFGSPHAYWRIDAAKLRVSGVAEQMRASHIVALPWPETGDISDVPYTRKGREELSIRVRERADLGGASLADVTQDLFNLALAIKEGDLVVVTEGGRGRAIGRVTGPYEYDAGSTLAHRRPVEWLDVGEWKAPDEKRLARALGRYERAANKLTVEKRLVHAGRDGVAPPPRSRLTGREGHIESVLDRKGQVILYGPPGTGKTYWAQRAAAALVAHELFGKTPDTLSDEERDRVRRHVRLCTFHPAYGYEDFLEGYRPEERDGQLVFRLRDGVFKMLCGEAAAHPQERFVLIIDEINRGDVPRIFGELLTVLEKDKRGREVHLPLSGQPFAVPPNVAVIGTMNTADRSIALLDTALRRRFGFIELMPESEPLRGVMVEGIPLAAWLDALNRKIVAKRGADGRNLQIGHAYLLEGGRPVSTLAGLARIMRDDIVPLLQEYCYEDYRMLADILGRDFVDAERQRIHVELFAEENRDALRQALLAMAPEITTSPEAVEAEAEAPGLEEEEAGEEGVGKQEVDEEALREERFGEARDASVEGTGEVPTADELKNTS